jgi:hypothetical protein
MLYLYFSFRNTGSELGLAFDIPVPNSGRLKSLLEKLLDDRRFSAAYSVAESLYDASELNQKITLLESLLGNDSLTDLDRVQFLQTYSDILIQAGKEDESDKAHHRADTLYHHLGHAYGEMMNELQRIQRRRTQQPLQTLANGIFEIMEKLEGIGYWHGVREALVALLTIARETSDDNLRAKANEEFARWRHFCGSSLLCAAQQMSEILEWDFAGGNAAKVLPPLETIYELLAGMEAPRLLEVVVYFLIEIYDKLGDSCKAAEW